MKVAGTIEQRAKSLLEQMRKTPMRRGALSEQAWQTRSDIEHELIAQRVPGPLARRVAFQLAFKFRVREIRDTEVLGALGQILRREVVSLKKRAGLREQRIAAALPKLSARQVLELLAELTREDRRIARTILHAAVSTADPLSAGRRYLAEYQLVARKLRAIDPAMARTIAGATFAARVPVSKAMEHLERFSSLIAKYQETPEMARMIARACYRAR
jgi:hypothetical protein